MLLILIVEKKKLQMDYALEAVNTMLSSKSRETSEDSECSSQCTSRDTSPSPSDHSSLSGPTPPSSPCLRWPLTPHPLVLSAAHRPAFHHLIINDNCPPQMQSHHSGPPNSSSSTGRRPPLSPQSPYRISSPRTRSSPRLHRQPTLNKAGQQHGASSMSLANVSKSLFYISSLWFWLSKILLNYLSY